jgi:hypothetical protein
LGHQDKPDTKAIIEILRSSESGRVAAIVGGALLDEHLRETLLERLRASGVADGLLRPDGALGNLRPKVDLLYLLHAFDKRTYKALRSISEIRNFFAHHLDASFDCEDETFLEAMKHLTLHEGRSHYPDPHSDKDTSIEIEEVGESRQLKFLVNLKLGLLELMNDRASHVRHSNQPCV